MMELKLIDCVGKIIGFIDASSDIFGKEHNRALVHQIVTSYLSNARVGSRKQKNRHEVNHSTRKPYKQKGTGRARAGMTSSPLWRGGGRAFPNTPFENFHKKINRKMYKAGICNIFSQLAREDRIRVIDDFSVSSHKTREAYAKFQNLGYKSLLVITCNIDSNLFLSTKNIPNICLSKPEVVDPVTLLSHENLLITVPALKKIEELYRA